MKDLKIINGRIPDFETDTWKTADILIHQGIIEEIGTVAAETRRTIDAAGKVVSPGFIDIHSHEDPISDGLPAFSAGPLSAAHGRDHRGSRQLRGKLRRPFRFAASSRSREALSTI